MLTKCNATIVLTVILLTPLVGRAFPNWDVFGDAAIEEGDAYNVVSVYDTPPGHTTVNMTGGLVDVLNLFDSTTLNVTGGRIMTLGAVDAVTLNISGEADVSMVDICASATMNISGGDVRIARARYGGTTNVSGAATVGTLEAHENAVLSMAGGSAVSLWMSGDAVANLRGGTLTEGIPVFRPSAIVNVYGTDLAKTDVGGLYGYGQVWGIYPDGSQFVIDLGEGVYPHVALIPEPASLLLLGVGGAIHRYCGDSRRTHARTGGDVC